MNILSIIGFFTSLFSFGGIVDWIIEIFNKMLLFLDGVAYTLLAYSFKLFQLMCTLNFNSMYGLISGVITRIKALIMVFVVYKLGITLINFMLNPDQASKKGKEILINIFITAALLLSYDTIFTAFNELSMLFVGTPSNYSYVVLGQIADLSDSKDVGLINRIVFGTDEQVEDVGEFIAFQTCSVFITYSSDPQNTEPLRSALNNNGKIDFYKLPDIASKIGKDFDYFYVVGFIGAIYMIYTFVKTTIQIGVRAFKLLILQILAPIAIITIIGEGLKGKVFSQFLKKYTAVYLEVITRMFSMLLICNFIVKFVRNMGDFFNDISQDEWYTYALMLLLLLVAAFKFAGDIPKFIDEILGTHLNTGKDKNFIGSLLGAGVGLASGLATGTLAGTIAGVAGGISAGGKGGSIADFFKGQAQNGANARNVGANARMAGGSLRYAGSRLAGAVGIPQAALERGKLASERQTAMDNMVKTLEDNYDGKAMVNGTEVGLNRDIFRTYAYDSSDTNGFYYDLSEATRTAVDDTNAAYEKYKDAQGHYDELRVSGASAAQLAAAWDEVEGSRTAYQSLKSSTDKKVDTDYNTKMLRDVQTDSKKYVKEKGRNAVEQSIETYDHVASNGHKTKDFVSGKSNTKKASDEYTTQQDRSTHSRTATTWNNSNSRGGSGK